MKIKLKDEINPKYMITPTDFQYVADKLYSMSENVSSEWLCTLLNKINNQNITEVDIKHRTYTIGGKTLSLSCMAPSEMLFLLSALSKFSGFNIMVYRYDKQLSNRVLKVYLSEFKDVSSIIILLDTRMCMTHVYGRALCLV